MELTTDDRDAGLEAPGGRRFRPDGKGVITLPDDLAAYGRRAARVTPLFRVRRRLTTGFDAAELGARYAAWEAKTGGALANRVCLGAGRERDDGDVAP